MAGKWARPTTPRAKGIGHKGVNMNINNLLDAQKEIDDNKKQEEKEVQQVNDEQQVDEKEEGE